MREIRFRAWDKRKNEWLSEKVHVYINDEGRVFVERDGPYGVCLDQVDVEVSFFTGLHDKNGKEIYEGDEFHMGDPNILYVVEWHHAGLMGRQVDNKSKIGLDFWKDNIEIIGNIYSKPELLNTK
jgi:hypothetical protein